MFVSNPYLDLSSHPVVREIYLFAIRLLTRKLVCISNHNFSQHAHSLTREPSACDHILHTLHRIRGHSLLG
jgi:hypothetical protein